MVDNLFTQITGKETSSDPFKDLRRDEPQGFTSQTEGFSADPEREEESRKRRRRRTTTTITEIKPKEITPEPQKVEEQIQPQSVDIKAQLIKDDTKTDPIKRAIFERGKDDFQIGKEIDRDLIKDEEFLKRTGSSGLTGVVREIPLQIQTGEDTFVDRPFTKKELGDPTIQPVFGSLSFGQGSFVTFGEQLQDIRAEQFVERQKFQEEAQKEFLEFSEPIVEKTRSALQSQIDIGTITVEEAKEQFGKELSSGRIEEQFKETDIFKGLESEAKQKIGRKSEFESFIVGQVFEQDLRTGRQKALDFVPIVGTGKRAVESLRDLSIEQQALVGAESILGTGEVSQKEFRKSLGRAGLDVGLLALDVALVGQVGKQTILASEKAVARNIESQISRGFESLGGQQLKGISVIEEGGEFILRGKQTLPGQAFFRDVRLSGKATDLDKGLSLISQARGEATGLGVVKTDFGKTIGGRIKTGLARGFGLAEERVVLELQTFDIGGLTLARKTGTSQAGLEGFRISGVSTFSPIGKSSFQISSRLGQLPGIEQQFLDNLIIGGQTITGLPKAGAIATPKGSFVFSPESAILNIRRPKIPDETIGFLGGRFSQKQITRQIPDIGLSFEGLEKVLAQRQITKPFQFKPLKTPTPPITSTLQFEAPKELQRTKSPLTIDFKVSEQQLIGISPLKSQIQSQKLAVSTISKQSTKNIQKQLSSQQLGTKLKSAQAQSLKTAPIGLTFDFKTPFSPISQFRGFEGFRGRFRLPIKLPRLPDLGEGFGNTFGRARRPKRQTPSLTGITAFELGGITGKLDPIGGGINLRFVDPLGLPKPRKKKTGKSKKKIDELLFTSL